jgi:adenine-specific DNA-methyltransferase
MNIRELISNTGKLPYKELCSALIERFGVKQTVKWDSVLPHEQQQSLFGGEILRLMSDHPTLANQKEIRPICLMKGELSQLLFFYVQLKDEKLPKATIERIARKFVGGAAADRYIIWFFGNKTADVLKIVISGKEGKKIRLKTLALEAGQWFKTYDYILSEVERKFNTGGLFQQFKEPSGLWKAVWDAFDISIVNKKFYAEIKAIFDALTKEDLPKCKGILTNDQDRVQFAIRLIGRIIFCWFLKRKGIIANDVLSSRAAESQQNYYRDLLELLFFDVFNTPLNERRKDLPDPIKNYPFLNGGLFEPQHQDHKGNWVLNISNSWFINFFNNTLERYNFTVDENSAASSEIAIDPEMLGRIFENLLAEHNPETGESARKATGSYYTPREIVDFMVEESLIAYLKTMPVNIDEAALYPLSKGIKPLSDEAIEDFVHTGTLPDALKPHSKELLDKLNAIKVLDPACGSGAFPISMLQKLAGLKQQLDPKTTPYDLKLKTIEDSIYGIDIQPMATELSRLRCWLSLIVDEDPKDIKPLPNLDFKFVTANSLIDLGYDEFILKVETGKMGSLFLTNFIKDLDALKAVRQKYFEPSLHQKEKDKLKKEFNTIKDDLFRMSLELIKQRLLDAEFANKITGWDPFDDSNPAPFFNKSWMFGLENGFDVVIGNPPYIKEYTHRKAFDGIRNSPYYQGKMDIWYLFACKYLDNLKGKAGVLTFIATNNWVTNAGASKLRNKIVKDGQILKLIDFGSYKIFESADIQTMILLCKHRNAKDNYILDYRHIKDKQANFDDVLDALLNNSNPKNEYLKSVFSRKGFEGKPFLFSAGHIEDILNKIASKANFKLDECKEVANGIDVHQDYVNKASKKVLGDRVNIGDGIYNLSEAEKTKLGFTKKELELIKPFYTTEELHRYYGNHRNTTWVIYTDSSFKYPQNITPYPSIKRHLDCFQAVITSDNKPYGLHRSREEYFFKGEKIVSLRKCAKPAFTYTDFDCYVSQTFYVIKSTRIDLKYLTGLLNSKLIAFWLKHKGKMQGHQYQIDKEPILGLPILKATVQNEKKISSLVDQILSLKQNNPSADATALEQEIDQMVYKLYDLTPEEIAIVEGKR